MVELRVVSGFNGKVGVQVKDRERTYISYASYTILEALRHEKVGGPINPEQRDKAPASRITSG